MRMNFVESTFPNSCSRIFCKRIYWIVSIFCSNLMKCTYVNLFLTLIEFGSFCDVIVTYSILFMHFQLFVSVYFIIFKTFQNN